MIAVLNSSIDLAKCITPWRSALLLIWCLLVLAKAAIAQPSGPSDPSQPPPAATAPERQSAHANLRAGDEAYRSGDYAAAELEYRRATDREPSYNAYYNLGLALAQQQRSEESAEAFARAERFAEEIDERSDAAFNAGTAHLEAEQLQESVQRYVDALRVNPNDKEAKQNLSHVLKQLRLQEPPPPQQQQQQSGDEGEESEEQQDNEEPQDGNSEPGDPSEGEPQENERESDQEQYGNGQEGTPTEAELDRQEAERLLQFARDQERQTQEKLKLDEGQAAKPLKDW